MRIRWQPEPNFTTNSQTGHVQYIVSKGIPGAGKSHKEQQALTLNQDGVTAKGLTGDPKGSHEVKISRVHFFFWLLCFNDLFERLLPHHLHLTARNYLGVPHLAPPASCSLVNCRNSLLETLYCVALNLIGGLELKNP